MKQLGTPENTARSSNSDNSQTQEDIYPLTYYFLFYTDQILQH